MTNAGDQKRTEDVPSRIKGLILAKLTIEACDTDDSHGDGCESRAKERSCSSDENLRRIHGPGSGCQTQEDGAGGKDGRGNDEDQPLRPNLVDDCPRWSLQCNRDDAPYRQCHPDTPGLPSGPGEVGCEKGTKSGLHIGEKEVCGFKSLYALLLLRCDCRHWISWLFQQRQ